MIIEIFPGNFLRTRRTKMTLTNTAFHLVSDCPTIQKRVSHCADLGEYMMEAINRQWLKQYGNTRYFLHSISMPIVNLVNPHLTLLEQWQLKRAQSLVPTTFHNDLIPA